MVVKVDKSKDFIDSGMTLITQVESDKYLRQHSQDKVSDTRIAQYLEKEMEWYTLGGKHYKFVKFKMPKAIFEELIADAKAQRVQ